jgi:hypothetical protein
MLSDRFLAWFTSTLPDAGVRASGKTQARIYRLTGGRLGGRFGRGPVLVLTTSVGARASRVARLSCTPATAIASSSSAPTQAATTA